MTKASPMSIAPTDRCIDHSKCLPGKYTKTIGSATSQPECEVCPAGFYKSLTSASSTTTDSCFTAHAKCPVGTFTKTAGTASAQPECEAHTKCPPGKYTKTAGTISAQPECEVCATGFFKDLTSSSSMTTDSCTIAQKITCPLGKYIHASTISQLKCTAHTKCPPGNYTKIIGNVNAQPQCEPCTPGLFKAFTSNSSTATDSCVAHTKCAPGKYTATSGSVTAQPKCKSCATGFFKSVTSKSSMCVGEQHKCPSFAMEHGDYCYATMDKCPPEYRHGACLQTCQSNYIRMPAGWTVVPDTTDIRSNVVARGTWGTNVIVLGSGRGYWGRGQTGSTGTLYTSSGWYVSGNSYRARSCSYKVLMRKSKTSFLPQGYSPHSTKNRYQIQICTNGRPVMPI